MCEYCNNPFSKNNSNSDENRIEFAGFFSADAITAAVQQAKQQRRPRQQQQGSSDDDSSDAESDGT